MGVCGQGRPSPVLLSLEESRWDPAPPALCSRETASSPGHFAQLTTWGRPGPCTPSQAFPPQRPPLGSAAASPGPLRSLPLPLPLAPSRSPSTSRDDVGSRGGRRGAPSASGSRCSLLGPASRFPAPPFSQASPPTPGRSYIRREEAGEGGSAAERSPGEESRERARARAWEARSEREEAAGRRDGTAGVRSRSPSASAASHVPLHQGRLQGAPRPDQR